MCMIDGADSLSVMVNRRHRVARTEHLCGECRRTILPGETYLREVVADDGHASTNKTCGHCEVVTEWLIRECGGYFYGGAREDMADHAYTGYYGFGVTRLAAGMRAKWTRKDGRMWPVPPAPPNTPGYRYEH